jgi:pimeloyl-ACP methyl ester carboxylesterase
MMTRKQQDLSNRVFSRRELLRAAFLSAAGLTVASSVAVSGARADSSEAIKSTETSFVEVKKEVRIFLQDWGPGKTIVFVHGWPYNHAMFDYQTLPLSRGGLRTVAIDLRGFGQSDKPFSGNDYDTWADDLGKVINALQLRDVTLAGFSMGGGICAHYVATRNDPRVKKLALLAAAAPAFPPKALDPFIQGVLADRAKLVQSLAALFFFNPVSPEFSEWLGDLGLDASPLAALRGLEEVQTRDLTSELRTIPIPTLICHGVHDQVVPFALAQQQQQLIRGSMLVPFENSGHGLFFDEKDLLNRQLAAFVAA